MRRVILPLLFVCLAAPASRGETVAQLIEKLADMKPDLEVVTRLDGNVYRSVENVHVARAALLAMPVATKPTYYEATTDVGKARVAVLEAGPSSARSVVVETCTEPTSACPVEDLQLVDVTCAPPHGNGFDGRAWVRLVCGEHKAPRPYDWQLARLDGHLADVFAWPTDPTYAYVQGENGSYQVAAYVGDGAEITFNVTLPVACRGALSK